MAEIQNQPFQLSFHGFLKVDFHGLPVTSDPSAKASRRQADGGLILVLELDEREPFPTNSFSWYNRGRIMESYGMEDADEWSSPVQHRARKRLSRTL